MENLPTEFGPFFLSGIKEKKYSVVFNYVR